MAAYVLIEIEVTDPSLYEQYKAKATPTITQYGGRYLVRGGKTETLEGDWPLKRLVVLQFESVGKAKAWWSSPEYSEAKKIRARAAKSKMVVAEGLQVP